MKTPPDKFVMEAAMQIVYGSNLFPSDRPLPTAAQVAEIIETHTKATLLRQALVSLKRSLDQHETKPEKFELLKTDWTQLDIFDQPTPQN